MNVGMEIRQGGGMAEWTNAAVLKTVEPKGSVGSNPTPSALAEIFRTN